MQLQSQKYPFGISVFLWTTNFVVEQTTTCKRWGYEASHEPRPKEVRKRALQSAYVDLFTLPQFLLYLPIISTEYTKSNKMMVHAYNLKRFLTRNSYIHLKRCKHCSTGN